MSAEPASDPYEALVRLAERERELARAGDLDALAVVRARRDAVLDALPARAPARAHPRVHEALRLQAEATALLAGARDEAGRELARLRQGRHGLAGYGRSARPGFDAAA